MKTRYILALLIALLIVACGQDENAAKSPNPGKENRQSVMIEELSLRDIDEYVRVSGRVEGITDITMNSESAGRILALYKKLGDTVAEGERIGQVENEVLGKRLESAQGARNSAEINLGIARNKLEYAQNSWDRNLISQAEYSASQAAFNAAQAAYDAAAANAESAALAYENSYLIAPASGTISQLYIAVGQYLNPGIPVADIIDASSLILKTGVGESQIGKLKTGQSAVIAHQGRSFTGSVRGFGISPLPGSSSYPVEINIPSASGILPGMVVSAKIKTNTFRKLLYTEIANINTEYDKNYLYVIENEQDTPIARKQEVSLGRSISEYVELLSGVKPGEQIVISGSENLEDGSAVKIRN